MHCFFIEWNNSGTILTSASLIGNSDGNSKIEKGLRVGASNLLCLLCF